MIERFCISSISFLGEYGVDDIAVDIGQTEVPALVSKSQTLVVEP
jgi:hypothetical protein